MAVRVMFPHGMDQSTSTKFDYEIGTKYATEDGAHGVMLHIYAGNKRIATHFPGTWIAAMIYDPDTERVSSGALMQMVDVRAAREKAEKKAAKKVVKAPKSRTKSGSAIRTSPLRTGSTNRGDGKKLR
jgi:hypothetical protein